MRAPADEQSGVGPFFERIRPECGSSAVAGVALGPPLSGRPIPPSQAAVTIRLPAGDGAQSAAVPTKVNGFASSFWLSSADAVAGTNAMSMVVANNTKRRFIWNLPPRAK